MTDEELIKRAKEFPKPAEFALQAKMIPNPLYCDRCEGRGYLVADAEWEPYAVQCDACKDRRPVPEPRTADQIGDEGDIVLHTIWLQPWCKGCDKYSWYPNSRQWCEHDAWGECEECGRKAAKFTLTSGDKGEQE